MTIVYRCDVCGKIHDSMISATYFPAGGRTGNVYIKVAIEKDGEIDRHMCTPCLQMALKSEYGF